MADKYFYCQNNPSGDWDDDGGGTPNGQWMTGAGGAGIACTKPGAGETWQLEANAWTDDNNVAATLGAGALDTYTLTLYGSGGDNQGSLKAAGLNLGAGALIFAGDNAFTTNSARFENTGAWTFGIGAIITCLASYERGELVSHTDMTLATDTVLDLWGDGTADFIITLNGGGTKRSILANRAGALGVRFTLEYVAVQYGGDLAIELQDCSASLNHVTFSGCDKDLGIQACAWPHVRINDVTFGASSWPAFKGVSADLVMSHCYWPVASTYAAWIYYGSHVVLDVGGMGITSGGNTATQPTTGFWIDDNSVVRCINFCDATATNRLDSAAQLIFEGARSYSGGWVTDWDNADHDLRGSSDTVQRRWLQQDGTAGQWVINADDDTHAAPSAVSPMIVPFSVPMVIDTECTVTLMVTSNNAASMTDKVVLKADPNATRGAAAVTDTSAIPGDNQWDTLSVAYTPTTAHGGSAGDKVQVPVELWVIGSANAATATFKTMTISGGVAGDDADVNALKVLPIGCQIEQATGGGGLLVHPGTTGGVSA